MADHDYSVADVKQYLYDGTVRKGFSLKQRKSFLKYAKNFQFFLYICIYISIRYIDNLYICIYISICISICISISIYMYIYIWRYSTFSPPPPFFMTDYDREFDAD